MRGIMADVSFAELLGFQRLMLFQDLTEGLGVKRTSSLFAEDAMMSSIIPQSGKICSKRQQLISKAFILTGKKKNIFLRNGIKTKAEKVSRI